MADSVQKFNRVPHGPVEERRNWQILELLLPQSTFDATRDPTSADDTVTGGWKEGSRWVNGVNHIMWVCTYAGVNESTGVYTPNTAVWQQMVGSNAVTGGTIAGSSIVAADDYLVLYDLSAGSNKRVTVQELLAFTPFVIGSLTGALSAVAGVVSATVPTANAVMTGKATSPYLTSSGVLVDSSNFMTGVEKLTIDGTSARGTTTILIDPTESVSQHGSLYLGNAISVFDGTNPGGNTTTITIDPSESTGVDFLRHGALKIAAGISPGFEVTRLEISPDAFGAAGAPQVRFFDGSTGRWEIVSDNNLTLRMASGKTFAFDESLGGITKIGTGTGVFVGSSGVVSTVSAVSVTRGGTGLSTLTSGAFLTGAGTGNVALVGPGTSGQIPISSGTAPVMQSLSGDATLAASGALTLASTITAGGPTGSSTVVPVITYDAKGRLTAVTTASISTNYAPPDATYIVQTANGTLTNEQALGALATGLLKNTTTTGVLSIAVAADLPVHVIATNLALGSQHSISGATSGQVLRASSATAANFQALAAADLSDGVGNLTATSPIVLSATRQVIGGAAVITHDSGSGNIHLPSGGTLGQILKNSGTSGTGAWGSVTESSGALQNVTTINMSGQLTNTVATGSAPLVISSTTVVANLNADLLDGIDSTAFGLVANPLSQFAATTSAQLAGVISDETGSGALVFATSPTLVTPILGTPTSGTLTNCTGLPVAGGGTGAATFTDGGVLIGNGTGAIQVTSAGTAGQVLTSNGAGVDPTFQAAASSGHTIRENGTDQTARTGLNFIDTSAGAGLITDDAGGNETEVNLTLYLLATGVRNLSGDWTTDTTKKHQFYGTGNFLQADTSASLLLSSPFVTVGDTSAGAWDFGDGSTTASATVNVLRPAADQKMWIGTAALAPIRIYNSEYYLRSSDAADGFYTKIINGNLTADNTLTLSVTATNTLTLTGSLTVETGSNIAINQDLTTDSTVATFATAQGTTSLISGSTGAANGLTLNATSLISNKTNQDIILDPNGTGQIVAMGDATQAIMQFQGSGGFANKPFINGSDGSLKFGATGTTYRLELTTGHSVTMYPESGITSGQIYLGGGFAATTQLATTTASASGDTTLFSQAITFTNTGEMMEMTATGTMAASASVTKAIKVKYDTKTITIYSALLNAAEDWLVKVRVWKASSGVKIIAECFTFGSVATTKIDYDTHTAASGTLSIIGNLSGTLTNGVVLEAGGPLVWWNQ